MPHNFTLVIVDIACNKHDSINYDTIKCHNDSVMKLLHPEMQLQLYSIYSYSPLY